MPEQLNPEFGPDEPRPQSNDDCAIRQTQREIKEFDEQKSKLIDAINREKIKAKSRVLASSGEQRGFPNKPDPMVLALEFNATARELGYSELDEEWLEHWFQNAFRVARDGNQ